MHKCVSDLANSDNQILWHEQENVDLIVVRVLVQQNFAFSWVSFINTQDKRPNRAWNRQMFNYTSWSGLCTW